MLIILILLILVCQIVLRKYDLRKYVNTSETRCRMSVNKHNPACGMYYCTMRYILSLLRLIWARRIYLTGDMTDLYSFIQVSLELPFSELFFSNVSLWNQYK